MTKKLTIVSIILIVINVLLMGWIFIQRPTDGRHSTHRKHHRSLERRLSKKLNFDDTQEGRFMEVSTKHKEVRSSIEKELRKVRKDLHQGIFEGDETQIDRHLLIMDSLHAKRERELTAHTIAIFGICEPQQKQTFLKLLNSRKRRIKSSR